MGPNRKPVENVCFFLVTLRTASLKETSIFKREKPEQTGNGKRVKLKDSSCRWKHMRSTCDSFCVSLIFKGFPSFSKLLHGSFKMSVNLLGRASFCI